MDIFIYYICNKKRYVKLFVPAIQLDAVLIVPTQQWYRALPFDRTRFMKGSDTGRDERAMTHVGVITPATALSSARSRHCRTRG
jgi:hypothetical protein